MNETDSVFVKEGSLVEVPYVEPSFWEVIMSSPWLQGPMAYEWMIWKMLCAICKTICAMCKMLCVVCSTIIIICMSLSWHNFPNLNLASPLTWLPKIMSLGKIYSFSCMSLVCACIYPYLVQVCTNTIQFYNFRWRHKGTLELIGWRCGYLDVALSSRLGRPSSFRGCLPLLSSLDIGCIEWRMFL